MTCLISRKQAAFRRMDGRMVATLDEDKMMPGGEYCSSPNADDWRIERKTEYGQFGAIRFGKGLERCNNAQKE